jgi:hypothetical protein
VKKGKYEIKPLDTIKCSDAVEMIEVHHSLSMQGYKTDFLYEKDGKKGLWIEILGRE